MLSFDLDIKTINYEKGRIFFNNLFRNDSCFL